MGSTRTGIEVLESSGEAETMEIGRSLAEQLQEGDLLLLEGDLGAGKTTLIRGVMQGLRDGGDTSFVKSPSYTILNIYLPDNLSDLAVHHFDFYRVEVESDLEELGLNDYWGKGICIVEWPKKFCHSLLGRIIDIEIKIGDGDGREILISPSGLLKT